MSSSATTLTTETATIARNTLCVAPASDSRTYAVAGELSCVPLRMRLVASTLCGRCPATSAGGFANRPARVALAIAPKMAVPTALPSERLII